MTFNFEEKRFLFEVLDDLTSTAHTCNIKDFPESQEMALRLFMKFKDELQGR